eukprot:6322794-Ditylum_brightwellii.AAC.1
MDDSDPMAREDTETKEAEPEPPQNAPIATGVTDEETTGETNKENEPDKEEESKLVMWAYQARMPSPVRRTQDQFNKMDR